MSDPLTAQEQHVARAVCELMPRRRSSAGLGIVRTPEPDDVVISTPRSLGTRPHQ